MRHKLWIAFLAGLLVLGTVVSPKLMAADNELVVVVNPGNTIGSLNKAQLGAVYRSRTKEIPGKGKVIAVNLPPGSAHRKTFDRAVLGMSPDECKRFWIDAMIRSGSTPPRKLASPAAVARFVGSEPEGLGYLPASDAKGLKIVARIRDGNVTGP